MSDSLAIKGVGDALLISVPEEDGPDALETLMQRIDERVEFFRGAHLAIDFAARDLHASDLGHLRDALSERLISLQTVLSTSDATLKAASDLGLETTLRREKSVDIEDQPLVTELDGEQAAFVQRTMRSGNSIQHPGHVVVLGDVNPGAEITAGGNVIVWGRLRGVVHAGAAGDESAVVCALDLAPAQLRIAGQIALSPERKGDPKPEVARIRDGQLVAEPWALSRTF
ncbi:MAG: septum site-determining protein MinC [Anaerolineales bacterium]|jgi:septum site-determining protein MinC